MKASIKARFVKALRSGDYKQTYGVMRDGDKFCVLGVLCNLHAQAHPEVAKKQKFKSSYLGKAVDLPLEVQQWAGVGSASPVLKGIPTTPSLMSLNDNKQLTFPEIATLIEFSNL